MGLDVYAGTLTRYCSGNWKNVIQQYAEANGHEFIKVNAEGEEVSNEPVNVELVINDVSEWLKAIIKALSKGETKFKPWQEDNDKPYFTDKPDWDAFGALLIYAALKVYDEKVPETLSRDEDFFTNSAVEKLAVD